MLSAAEIESFQRFSDLESMWPLSSEYLSETVEPTLRDSMGSDEEAQQLPVFPAPYEDRPLSTEYIMGIQSPPPSALTKETGLPPRLGMEITAFDPDYTPGDGRLPGSMFHDDFRAAASDLPPGALGAHGYGGAQLAARLPSARLPPAELWADVDEPEFVRTGGGPALPTLIQPPPAPPSRRFGSSLDKNSFDTALRAGRAKSGQAPSLARRQTSETLFEETVATLPAGVPASMTPEGASLTIRSPPDVTISSGDYPQNTSFNTLERSARPPVRDQRDVVHESALGASARLGSLSSSGGATQPHAVSSSGSSASFGSTGRRALASTAQLSAAAGPEFYPVVSGGGVLVEDVIQSLEDRERQRFHHQELIRQHEDTMATPLPVAGTSFFFFCRRRSKILED
ncbi:hypothetical protein DIPPA_18913 [Diplonema papillatum]|nr:hypothetical protein DIPPA_17566 [Diplonema papillatum]KAJ9441394.1 hypothetical protein DIPPA_18913 [Diplonema papillatum]